VVDDASSLPTRSHANVTSSSSGARIVVLSRGGLVAARDVRPGKTLVLGRARECDLHVIDPALSRRHLAFHGGPPLAVEDLGSQNGTRAWGRKIPANVKTPLATGAIVEAGDTVVIVQASGLEAAGRTPTSRAELDRLLALVAKSELSVVLIGETGVGKEVYAERVHQSSRRAKGPLLRLNCAAFQENLLESELFGHERGAFTGALTSKPGLLERARGGTVFFDELGEMPLGTQAKLLRAIETHEVMRVGGLTPIPLDVRYVAATNRDLEERIAQGAFRRDLYFRLDGITLRIPPLRERRDEIAELARTFVAEASSAAGVTPRPLSADVVAILEAHDWPGNVRELRNTIARAVVLSEGGPIAPAHLLLDAAPASVPVAATLPATVDEFERARIEEALRLHGGNQTRTAEALGISRRTLVNRLSAYGLTKPRK
jgi:DNA-binding NtrC family response regulator